jgi:formamidopyrimidine-DNA glycosylase
MPELPEVETTLRGIQAHIENRCITKIVIRQHRLRWEIPSNLPTVLAGKKVSEIIRRGKYLLFKIDEGALLLHLGMSGRLRILTQPVPPQKHDHVDIEFSNNIILRFTDPRRFGALLWINNEIDAHPLLAKLGPEPLTHHFSSSYLYKRAQARTVTIKSFIMDNKIVVGVGNIYANEALFLAGIHPTKPAKSLSKENMVKLVKAIKHILRQAIQQGGTTLKDFLSSEGKPGYFMNKLKVYGREGLPCLICHSTLLAMRIGQRTTVYCPQCQH